MSFVKPATQDDVHIGDVFFHQEETIDRRGKIGWDELWIVTGKTDDACTLLKVHTDDSYDFAIDQPRTVTVKTVQVARGEIMAQLERGYMDRIQVGLAVGATRRRYSE